MSHPVRIFAALFVVAALALSGCDGDSDGSGTAAFDLGGPAALPDGSFDYDLTLLYTNDLHDQVLPILGRRGGYARQGSLLRLLREQAAERGKAIMTINGGDNLEGTIFYDTDGGVLQYRLLEALGYDVVQIGNHDHQFGVERLHDILTTAFPGQTQSMRVLWGNVNPSEMSALGTDPNDVQAAFVPAQVAPEVITSFENAFIDFDTGAVDSTLMDAPDANSKLFNQTLFYTVGGLRIGFFGLDTDEVLYTSVPGEGDLFVNADGRSENLRFYSPANHSFASDMITYLNDPDGNPATDDGADVIVAVTHIGLDVDQTVAMNAVGATGRHIDVIVGGHSHTRINTAVTVDHLDGSSTLIVQAGSRGEFVGRLDLAVNTTTNRSTLRNCELLQVDDRLTDDPAIRDIIVQGIEGPAGVDATFGGMPTATPIVQSPIDLPGGVAAVSALGNLAADACIAVGNAPPNVLGLDAMLIGNFVFRGDLGQGQGTANDIESILPLHVLDRTGRTNDHVHFVDFQGGLREALDPSTFPIPAPNLTGITEIEYFLEIAYGIADILNVLGQFLGIEIGGVESFVEGLQWGGIEFVVDATAPALHRIDPSTIVIGGLPLVGNEAQSWRLGINSIIAEIALPFFQLLTMIEDSPGSSIFVPFPQYDPVLNATPLVIWEALRDHLTQIGTLGANDLRVGGARPRTQAPDLTFEPIDVVVQAPGAPGGPHTLIVPIINIGTTAAVSATLVAFVDPTPEVDTDDPDGITDLLTGAMQPMVGSVSVGMVPGFSGGQPGTTTVSISVTLPAMLPAGTYPIALRIVGVTSFDPTRPEEVTANNGGSGYEVPLSQP